MVVHRRNRKAGVAKLVVINSALVAGLLSVAGLLALEWGLEQMRSVSGALLGTRGRGAPTGPCDPGRYGEQTDVLEFLDGRSPACAASAEVHYVQEAER